jgi:acyl-coenzyme A synthetase/AMP-(fatty) acid ligase
MARRRLRAAFLTAQCTGIHTASFIVACTGGLRCQRLGFEPGDRIGTLCWNSFRHLELWQIPFALSERDTILQVIPMFHANGWGIPYAGVMTGSRLVMSGGHLQPSDVAMLIETEKVTISSGVPTVWMGLHAYLENHPRDISSLRKIVVAGSAMPASSWSPIGRNMACM